MAENDERMDRAERYLHEHAQRITRVEVEVHAVRAMLRIVIGLLVATGALNVWAVMQR